MPACIWHDEIPSDFVREIWNQLEGFLLKRTEREPPSTARMINFTAAEVQILEDHKEQWKSAADKHGKNTIYREVVTAAHRLQETRTMGKQEWEVRKKESTFVLDLTLANTTI